MNKPRRERHLDRGDIVVFNERAGEGYIRPDRRRSEGPQIYFDAQSLRDPRTRLQEGARVSFVADHRSSPPYARDLCIEPSVTEQLAKLPDVVTGKVIHVNAEERYGFVQVSPRVQAWFGFNALANPDLMPLVGDSVSCSIIQTQEGRLRAQNLVILEPVEDSAEQEPAPPEETTAPTTAA